MSRLVITISHNAVFQAECLITGCSKCTSALCVPFARVLDSLRQYDPGEVDYILSVQGRCPICRAPLTEDTLVKFR
jgi:hypothetical protein